MTEQNPETETPAEEVVYTQPTSALDLERRLSEEGEAPVFNKTVNPEDANFDKDGYVSTDPIYQNHATDTDKPLAGETEDGETGFTLAEAGMEHVFEKNEPSEPLVQTYGGVTPHTSSEAKSEGAPAEPEAQSGAQADEGQGKEQSGPFDN